MVGAEWRSLSLHDPGPPSIFFRFLFFSRLRRGFDRVAAVVEAGKTLRRIKRVKLAHDFAAVLLPSAAIRSRKLAGPAASAAAADG